MKIRMLIPALLLSAAFVTPAAANYFHNPFENIYRNVGSAPNPTPQDVRENRLPIVTRNETNETRFPIVEAIRSMFSGRSAQAQSGSTQNVPTASPSR